MTTNKNRTIKTDYPKPNIYSVEYSCANCGWSGSINFMKGTQAPDTTTCPTCEVNGANKSLPYRVSETTKKDPVPMPIIPIAWPQNSTPCPRVLPRPNPWIPYTPWNEPTRPHFKDIGNDIDSAIARWRENMIYIDDWDEGLGFNQ